jgi:hypothetical protein
MKNEKWKGGRVLTLISTSLEGSEVMRGGGNGNGN